MHTGDAYGALPKVFFESAGCDCEFGDIIYICIYVYMGVVGL